MRGNVPVVYDAERTIQIEKFGSPVSCERYHSARGTLVGEIGELHKPLLCSS